MALLEPAPGRGGEVRAPTRDEAFLPIAADDDRDYGVTPHTVVLLGALGLGFVSGCIWNYNNSDPHRFINPYIRNFPTLALESGADSATTPRAVKPLSSGANLEVEIKFKGVVPTVFPHELGAAIQITNKGPPLKAVFVKCLALADGGNPIGFGIKQAPEIPRNAVVFDEVRIDTGGRKQAGIECYPATLVRSE